MIEAVFYLNDDNRVWAFEISGHARYAQKGDDIVCSAVSALVLTTILGIEEILELKAGLEQEDGYTYFCLPSEMEARDEDRALLLLDTLFAGIKKIAQQYRRNISVLIEKLNEVPDFTEDVNIIPFGDDTMAHEIETMETEMVKKSNPYTAEKVLGVALLGAATGVLLYYIYNQLGEDSKAAVKNTIVEQVKSQVQRIVAQ
ncbi:MAG: ribosomal-processing cysteine protease Prp [Firmicutes bacterium]|nr:ribosomal-processing cysteine protease Prp [Bacillota bacterium]